MSVHRPSWFSDTHVMVSTAPTCGLTKGGRTLPLIDSATGTKVQIPDPETGELVDAVNDKLLADMQALAEGKVTNTLWSIRREDVSLRNAVPVYYDRRFEHEFREEMKKPEFEGFRSASIGDLVKSKLITVRGGHGSPTADQRVGDVPYIKVSDLRAGLVNINPTNRVPRRIAEKHWRRPNSGLKAFDLLCPERTSKNIGDFCVLMPGQEQVLLTKEIIVLRPGEEANFDPFYLLWAMTLNVVRDQWKRIVFMQTNREDVGGRYLEIQIPVPETPEIATKVSEPFRNYYTALANARAGFAEYLRNSGSHHFFVSGVEPPDAEEQIIAETVADSDSQSSNESDSEDRVASAD